MPRRYHPLLVALHWLTAALILMALFAGGVVLDDMPNSDPAKVAALGPHMVLGILILALMLVRLAVRLTTARPAPADAGSPALNAAAALTHWGLYAAAIAMAGSGIALSAAAGLPGVVFGGTGALPPDFDAFAARAAHGAIATLLMALIVLHVLAALWHAGVKGDGLMGRMWFGTR